MEIPSELLYTLEIASRVLLSIILAAILGWERQVRKKPAGLRTHMMVSMGAAVFTLLTLELFQTTISNSPQSQADPIRIVEGIVGGIGFLGAGTIIRSRGAVEGVTTAASIWVAGAIGAACGGGYYQIAVITAVFAWLILTVVRLLEKWTGNA